MTPILVTHADNATIIVSVLKKLNRIAISKKYNYFKSQSILIESIKTSKC